jgi:nicotinamide-nucleotide adenylyltransferase/phosphinothricin biosynthesis protein PhpF
MWERTNEQKITSGTEVRSKIILGEPWENLVPDSVSIFIKKNEIDQRIIWMSEEG